VMQLDHLHPASVCLIREDAGEFVVRTVIHGHSHGHGHGNGLPCS
jgi:hypothetical protein